MLAAVSGLAYALGSILKVNVTELFRHNHSAFGRLCTVAGWRWTS